MTLFYSSKNTKIGGINKIIEINESKFGKRNIIKIDKSKVYEFLEI